MPPLSVLFPLTIPVIVTVLAGCASPRAPLRPSAADTTATSATLEATEHVVPVVRYGRYTLVELRPEPSQRDLSQQVVDVTMPAHPSATVGDGMRHLLQRTGYSLCHIDEAAALYALPLPAAHLQLGPLTLRDALQTLAGPAWRLVLDQGSRQVCFTRESEPTEPAIAGAAS
ncbi:PilL N-terminal domain-containing protein [Burkholderia sp. F1]|uniref:PFGI-1 class ICE element type IV pilus protein PilL2 n=1 Tax=Burkholderia sp. F1 TaxID=3366817 RepID=UPI003D71E27A